MQRTNFLAGSGANTQINGSFTGFGPYFSPLGNCGGPVNEQNFNLTGASNFYGLNQFACVLTGLYQTATEAGGALTLTANVNVNGATGTAGNLASVYTTAASHSNGAYYSYDSTDFDSLTAGQYVGYMQTISTASVHVSVPSLGVICDTLGQGFTSVYATAASVADPIASSNRYGAISGGLGFNSNAAPPQQYAGAAFVAWGLNWLVTAASSVTNTFTPAFGYTATAGAVPTTSSLKTLAAANGYVGLMQDVTDFCSVPAGDYYEYVFIGSDNGGSGTLRFSSLGVHFQSASNAGFSLTGSYQAVGVVAAPSTVNLHMGIRVGTNWFESMSCAPSSGVFSSLAVDVTTTPGATGAYNLARAQSLSDDGVSSGQINGSTTSSNYSSFTLTSLLAAFPAAAGFVFDTTDFAAFTGRTDHPLMEMTGAGSIAFANLSMVYTAAQPSGGAKPDQMSLMGVG